MTESSAIVPYIGRELSYFEYLRQGQVSDDTTKQKVEDAKNVMLKQANFKFYAYNTFYNDLYVNDPTGKRDPSNRNFIVCHNYQSPLSSVWKRDGLAWGIVSYPLGMIGYAVTLVARVVHLVYRICALAFQILLCSGTWHNILVSAHRVAICALEILTSVVGIICPPLGYFLDRKVDLIAEKGKTRFYHTLEVPLKEALEAFEYSPDATPSLEDLKKRRKAYVLQYHIDKNANKDPIELPKDVTMTEITSGTLNAYQLLEDYFRDPEAYIAQLKALPTKDDNDSKSSGKKSAESNITKYPLIYRLVEPGSKWEEYLIALNTWVESWTTEPEKARSDQAEREKLYQELNEFLKSLNQEHSFRDI